MPQRPLHDYKLCAFLLPLVLSGCYWGMIINKELPRTPLFVIIIIFLVFISFETFSAAINYQRKEQK